LAKRKIVKSSDINNVSPVGDSTTDLLHISEFNKLNNYWTVNIRPPDNFYLNGILYAGLAFKKQDGSYFILDEKYETPVKIPLKKKYIENNNILNKKSTYFRQNKAISLNSRESHTRNIFNVKRIREIIKGMAGKKINSIQRVTKRSLGNKRRR
jgi:hypothetical protein